MNTSHKLQITFDEGTGQVRATHRVTVMVGDIPVSHWVELDLDGLDELRAKMTELIDANREVMETDGKSLAVMHAAAVEAAKKKPQPGDKIKRISVGGTLGATGGTVTKKGSKLG